MEIRLMTYSSHWEKPSSFCLKDATAFWNAQPQGLECRYFKGHHLTDHQSRWFEHLSQEGRWETGSPQVLSSVFLSPWILLFEDHSLADSLVMQHRQGHLANLTASLKCCPKPGILTLLQEKWSWTLISWQASSLLNPSLVLHILHISDKQDLVQPHSTFVASILVKQHQVFKS